MYERINCTRNSQKSHLQWPLDANEPPTGGPNIEADAHTCASETRCVRYLNSGVVEKETYGADYSNVHSSFTKSDQVADDDFC